MKKDLIQSLISDFESHSKKTDNGVEFWLARDLQKLLEYDEWRNFTTVIDKAKTACELSGGEITDHFVDVNKTIEMPKRASKIIADFMLTRYACYLIAQNGDSRKKEVSFAQTYFAIQTRKLEVIEKRLIESERVLAREKLATTEKELSSIIFEQTGSDRNFGIIRSKGDKALFGYTTGQMKKKWKVPKSRALADFAPTIILKAKDFATEITIFNSKAHRLKTEQAISGEHVTNNKSVRKTLLERGINPGSLPADPDVKKVSRRLKSEKKKVLKRSESLK